MDSQISISARGAFSNPLDIRNRNAPGSPASYGMSKSTCGVNYCHQVIPYRAKSHSTLDWKGQRCLFCSRSIKEILWETGILRFGVYAARNCPSRDSRPKSYLRARINKPSQSIYYCAGMHRALMQPPSWLINQRTENFESRIRTTCKND
jgi:hypothetical protein